jgi:hypothetical protein
MEELIVPNNENVNLVNVNELMKEYDISRATLYR